MTKASAGELLVVKVCGVLTEKLLVEFAYACFHDGPKEQLLFVSPNMLAALVAYNSERFRMRPSFAVANQWEVTTGIGKWAVRLDNSDHSDEPTWAASSFPLEGGDAIACLDGMRDYAF